MLGNGPDFDILWLNNKHVPADYTIECNDGKNLEVHSFVLLQTQYFVPLLFGNFTKPTKISLNYSYPAVYSLIETLYTSYVSSENLLAKLYRAIETNTWDKDLLSIHEMFNLADFIGYNLSNKFDYLTSLKKTTNLQLQGLIYAYTEKEYIDCCLDKYSVVDLVEYFSPDAETVETVSLKLKSKVKYWNYIFCCSQKIPNINPNNYIERLKLNICQLPKDLIERLIDDKNWCPVVAKASYYQICKL